MTPLLDIVEVSKSFARVQALQQFSLQLAPGQLLGVVGPDGAGKTTLMRLLAGLMVPTTGKITVAGSDTVLQQKSVHQLVGYMPQRFGLYEDLSVQENLRLYADLRGVPGARREVLYQQLLGFTGLAPFTRRLARALSGGMKQKLGLACALLGQPRLLLLDEPGVGVDPISRQELWRMVHQLKDDGMAVVWSTAYMDEAERCDDVLVLDEGQQVYRGSPVALTASLAGRSFRVLNINGDRRRWLIQALQLDCVKDGVIEGAAVRLTLADQQPSAELSALLAASDARVQPVPPRFEDAFIDRVGGAAKNGSPLAAQMPDLPDDGREMVSCVDLSKNFGAFVAADGISFTVRRGEVLGLLGPNGAGKSTTFKMLCGLLKPSAGTAQVMGLDLRRAAGDAKRQLGYMAQKFALYNLLTVEQNLNFFAGAYGLSGKAKRKRIKNMVKVFGLKPYLGASPDTLPLGFKQRLALACALMHRPPVLFLDEPTSGVDPATRREFWAHITGLVGKGVTVLVTTHFMDEAEYCDRVALINRGRLVALDTPDALKQKAATAAMPQPSLEQAFIALVNASGEG